MGFPLVIWAAWLAPRAEAGCVRISEFLANPTGPDDGYEWLELLNTCLTDVDLAASGVAIRVGHRGATTDVPLAGIVPNGERYVIGEPLVPWADAVVQRIGMYNAASEAEYLALVENGTVVDTVVYGFPNTALWPDDADPVAVRLAPVPIVAWPTARWPELKDLDDSAVEFVNTARPTPGGVNSGTQACTPAGSVVLNELRTGGSQWVELVAQGNQVVDLSGWQFQSGISQLQAAAVIDAGATLAPGEHFVLGASAGAAVDEVDSVVVRSDTAGNAGANVLVDCLGDVADTVVWGRSNGYGWVDDTGVVATSLPPPAGPGMETLARVREGVDSDLSGVDFALVAQPTQGERNRFEQLPATLQVGVEAEWSLQNAVPGGTVYLIGGLSAGAGPCPPQLAGLCVGVLAPTILDTDVTDANGLSLLSWIPPAGTSGRAGHLQLVEVSTDPWVGQVVARTVAP